MEGAYLNDNMKNGETEKCIPNSTTRRNHSEGDNLKEAMPWKARRTKII